jgi:hypothetical protein
MDQTGACNKTVLDTVCSRIIELGYCHLVTRKEKKQVGRGKQSTVKEKAYM